MKLYANRVVLILHGVFVVLTAAGVFIAAVHDSIPAKWQADIALAGTIIAALAAGTVAVVKFLDGSQKSEALDKTQPAAAVAVELPGPDVEIPTSQIHKAAESSA